MKMTFLSVEIIVLKYVKIICCFLGFFFTFKVAVFVILIIFSPPIILKIIITIIFNGITNDF